MPEQHAGHAHDGRGSHEHDHPHPHAETAPVLHLPTDGRLLTPADVRNKVFATVRVREGYDMAQVDGFLDQVEATLELILRENTELKRRPARSPADGSAPQIIALAQEAADRAVAMAKEQAGDIIADARDRAEATRREALTYGGRIREGLQDQIHRLRALLTELEKRTAHAADLGPPTGPAPDTRPSGDVR
ncbi:DivIVA domain-containing protein [Actinoallomurus sp. NBC_01490]|uniref:DivIVA domain-containing protein n=1 Tax=Actinoallomurus sp. NBC_01490 TaxID=2903557 RepID=UPI002E34A947|nr:DivIVA domain-containing protein [Actinoallomurus sp. NBC_01490]